MSFSLNDIMTVIINHEQNVKIKLNSNSNIAGGIITLMNHICNKQGH